MTTLIWHTLPLSIADVLFFCLLYFHTNVSLLLTRGASTRRWEEREREEKEAQWKREVVSTFVREKFYFFFSSSAYSTWSHLIFSLNVFKWKVNLNVNQVKVVGSLSLSFSSRALFTQINLLKRKDTLQWEYQWRVIHWLRVHFTCMVFFLPLTHSSY